MTKCIRFQPFPRQRTNESCGRWHVHLSRCSMTVALQSFTVLISFLIVLPGASTNAEIITHVSFDAAGIPVDSTGNVTYFNSGATYSQTTGAIGSGRDLSAAGEYVGITAGAAALNRMGDVDNESGLTVSIWIKGTSTSGQIFSSDDGRTFQFEAASDGQVRYRMANSFVNVLSGPLNAPLASSDGWHQMLLTADFASTSENVHVYLDGTLLSTLDRDFAANGEFIPDGGSNIRFKLGVDRRTPTYLSGSADISYDDMAIWVNPLTTAQAVSLYNLGITQGFSVNAYDAQRLWDHFNLGAGAGSITAGNQTWVYTTGLTGDPGTFDGSAIILDELGNGMVAVPEPGSLAMLLVGLAAIARTAKYR